MSVNPEHVKGIPEGLLTNFPLSNLRNALMRLAPVVILSLLLAGCASQKPTSAQSPLVVPTPITTPPSGLVPTPPVSYYDNAPTYRSTDEGVAVDAATYCSAVKEFQGNGPIPAGDKITLSPNAAAALSPEELQLLNIGVEDFNAVASPSCDFGDPGKGPVFVALAHRGVSKNTLAYVHLANNSCADTQPTFYVNLDGLLFNEKVPGNSLNKVATHELAHTCIPRTTTDFSTISAKPAYTFALDENQQFSIVVPDFEEIITNGFIIFEREGKVSSGIVVYPVFEEIKAEMFVILNAIYNDPNMSNLSIYDLVYEAGVGYSGEVISFYESLNLNGFVISPEELASLFVTYADNVNAIPEVARALEYYKDPLVYPDVVPEDVFASYAIANK